MKQPTLLLGIDTGGTFTDGVILESGTRRVLNTVKVLTTHHDLRQCIGETLERLLPDDPQRIGLVSLSTTLATNAIVEGKRRPAGLLLLGYDQELVETFGFHKRFGAEVFAFIPGRHDLSTGAEEEPLDEEALRLALSGWDGRVEAYAVVSYAGPANAEHEERAAAIVAGLTGKPVIQAHQLSSELNSIWRATTAALNASLLGNTRQLLEAVEAVLRPAGVTCPVMMVRGDGSIVQAAFARQRPVEVIHSGPATSAIGGQFLSGAERALVIDIGGTTTDLSLVERGRVLLAERAASVGDYQTCVRTIRARSFGIGGDSRIAFDHWGRLEIGPQRALPISRLCARHPEIKRELGAALAERDGILYSESFEYWLLRREPQHDPEDERTRRLLDLLRRGPQRSGAANRLVGPIAPFTIRQLLDQEIIERAALTPTDLLHARGDFTAWDAEAAVWMVEAAARAFDISPAAFIQRIFDQITNRIAGEIVQFLAQRPLSATPETLEKPPLDRWLFEQSMRPDHPYLQSTLSLRLPLVGIGAPAAALLPPVAAALHAELIIPEHFAVANAVGAVVSQVIFRHEAEVLPAVEGPALTGYFVRAANQQTKFSNFEGAVAFARQAVSDYVTQQAQAAGANDIQVEIKETLIWTGMLKISAWAAGAAPITTSQG